MMQKTQRNRRSRSTTTTPTETRNPKRPPSFNRHRSPPQFHYSITSSSLRDPPSKNVTVYNNNISGSRNALQRSAETQQFNSTIVSLNQMIRELFLPTTKLTLFTQMSENLNQTGIQTIKDMSVDPQNFLSLWEDFVEEFHSYSAMNPKERILSFFESAVDTMNGVFDSIAAYPPVNVSSNQQWKQLLSAFRSELNQISCNLQDFDSAPVVDQLNMFLQRLNDTKLFKLATFSMVKRESASFKMKHAVERVIKSIDNYNNKDKILVEAQKKIDCFTSTFSQIFFPNKSQQPTLKPSSSAPNVPVFDNVEEKPADNRLRNARRDNKLFKKKLELALQEEETVSKALHTKEAYLESTRKELKSLRLTKMTNIAIQQRNDARKNKSDIQSEVKTLHNEIPKLEEKLRIKKDEHAKFVSTKKELEDATKENELQKALKKHLSGFLQRLDKNEDIKKLQTDLNKVSDEFEELLNKRKNNPTLMYYDAQRFQQENQRLQTELQEIQLRSINLTKDNDECDTYFKSALQSAKKELKELENQKLNPQQKVVQPQRELIQRNDFDGIQSVIEQRTQLQKEYYHLLKGPQEETKTRRKEIKILLAKLPPISKNHCRLKEAEEFLSVARNEAKIALETELASIVAYNDVVKKKNESETAVVVARHRLEQLQIPFEHDDAKIEKLRKLTDERVEMNEKLRTIEEKFMRLFGERIPPKATLSLSLPEKIELVTRQFNKK